MVSEITFIDKEDQPWVKIAKKRLQNGIAALRRQFGDQPTRAMHAVLPTRVLAGALEAEVKAYRERLYPPLTTLGLFIGQALSPGRGVPGRGGAAPERTTRSGCQWL